MFNLDNMQKLLIGILGLVIIAAGILIVTKSNRAQYSETARVGFNVIVGVVMPPGPGADIDTGDGAAAGGELPPPIGPGGSGGGASGLPGASVNEIPTIRPIGIYVDDTGKPEYIRLEDPQLDVDGVEHTEMNDAVTYQSDKARASIGGASNG